VIPWNRFNAKALRRLAYCVIAVLVAVPASYAATVAARVTSVWTTATGQPLRIVAGDKTNWLAGLIALSCCETPPSLFTNGDFSLSPWITEERIAREGVLIIWRDGDLERSRESCAPDRQPDSVALRASRFHGPPVPSPST
jgi:hypothetical protein